MFVGTTIVAGAATPGYDASAQAISELFATGAPTAVAMKAALLGFAVLALPFTLVLRHAPFGGIPAAGAAVLVDAAGTAALVFVPCTPGCPGPGASTVDLVHLVVAGIAYVGHLSAPVLAWRALRGRSADEARLLATVSAVLGALGLAGFAVWVSGAGGGSGGFWQRAFTIAVDLWFVAVGVAVVREALHGRDPEPSG